MTPNDIILPHDRDALREQFRNATPFRFISIDRFLDERFAAELAASYPSYQTARAVGEKEFEAVNEKRKIQITDRARFPSPVGILADTLSSPAFLADVEHITGIPRLLADPHYGGGGMHLTNTSGRLDVHVDFNFSDELQAFRRLNILVYLNPEWKKEWGGAIELWDKDVRHCSFSATPLLNRCVMFETTKTSFHGVTPLRCPPDVARKSFAAYYYTKEPPANWDGEKHTTIFRTRPTEKARKYILMPGERIANRVQATVDRAARLLKKITGNKPG